MLNYYYIILPFNGWEIKVLWELYFLCKDPCVTGNEVIILSLLKVHSLTNVWVFYCHCNKLPQTWWYQKHKFTVLLFGRLEIQNRSHWGKINMFGKAVFLLEDLVDYSFPALFQLREATTLLSTWLRSVSGTGIAFWVLLTQHCLNTLLPPCFSLSHSLYFWYFISLNYYSWFIIFYYFQVYNKVNKFYIYIYPFFFPI